MATAFIQPPKSFEPGKNPAQAWREWRSAFELYEEACEYTKKKDGPRRALLLHALGTEARKTYQGFVFPPGQPETSTAILDCFDKLYKPYRNVTHASAIFNTIVQKPGQTIDELVAELKIHANDCDYGEMTDRMVGDRIVVGIRDTALKERLLREPSLTLDKIINTCKSAEISRVQAQNLQQTTATMSSTVDNLKQGANKPATTNTRWKKGNNKQNKYQSNKYGRQQQQRTCTRCGMSHNPGNCPAYGTNCDKCGKFGHFAKFCRQRSSNSQTRRVAALSEDDDSNDESFFIGEFTVDNIKQNNKWVHPININGNDIDFKLDTGSDVNILPTKTFQDWNTKPKIEAASTKITTYTGEKLQLIGKCQLECSIPSKKGKFKFFIINGDRTPILGAEACEELGLIVRKQPQQTISAITTLSLESIINEFPDVFTGIGKLPGTYSITLQPNANPKIVAPRRIPQAIQQTVRDELIKMEADGIITKVTEPTEWVHPITIARKKPGGIRICLDPRQMNLAIMREHYRIPTQEELFSKLQGCKVFSLIDAKNAFWHLELDKPSSLLCTFATPWGCYRFLRMPFGVNCAPEQFQRAMDEIFKGKNNFQPYFDDILVATKTAEEHKKQIVELLTLAREKGLKLNKNKVKLGQTSITYLGHIVSHLGIKPDPAKVDAITQMKPPTNTAELMRLLGMVTYLTKFIPQFSQNTNQLRSLLKTNTQWIWDSNVEKEFQQLKFLLTTAPVLQHFNPKLPSIISTDASSYGVGSVLLQDDKPIAYASASLSQTQQSWAQIEKELLAVVFSCERFHYYIYGTKIEVHTDHKPLLGLLNKPLEKITPRLQRLLLRLQKYDLTLRYVPGKYLNIADTLSRAPKSKELILPSDISNDITICTLVSVTTQKLKQLQAETKADMTLQEVVKYITNGWPNIKNIRDERLKAFHKCRQELHIVDGLLCRAQRLVIPTANQRDVLEKLHIAHRGIVSTKNKARHTLYWPTMNRDIEEMIASCTTCQRFQNNNQREPLADREIPTRPWQCVAMDFFHLSNVTYILIIDYFSKYVEVQPAKSTTAKGVIASLKAIFARFGIPCELVSDNGPPMDSEEIKDFFKDWDIQHNPAAPYNPRSNGLAERSVQTLKKSLTKAFEDSKDLFAVLMDHRNTPMDGLRSPAELLMGRKIRTLVPILPTNLNPYYETKDAKDQLKIRQQRQHLYADKHTKPLGPLTLNQKVWFTLSKGWQMGTIIQIGPQKRTYTIRGPNGSNYKRNRFHIKPYIHQEDKSPHSTMDDEINRMPEDYHLNGDTEDKSHPKIRKSGRRTVIPTRYRY